VANPDGLTAWERNGNYCITNGRHWIAKLLSHGVPGYLVWLDGKLAGPCFKTSAEARAWVAANEKQDSTPGCD
jgi:hypothetical protein